MEQAAAEGRTAAAADLTAYVAEAGEKADAALQKADKAWGALHDVAVLLTDCAKALLPLAGELAVKAVRQLRQRRA